MEIKFQTFFDGLHRDALDKRAAHTDPKNGQMSFAFSYKLPGNRWVSYQILSFFGNDQGAEVFVGGSWAPSKLSPQVLQEFSNQFEGGVEPSFKGSRRFREAEAATEHSFVFERGGIASAYLIIEAWGVNAAAPLWKGVEDSGTSLGARDGRHNRG